MAGVPVPVIAAVALVVACLLTPLFCSPPAVTFNRVHSFTAETRVRFP
jgi:hypothetical protein